MDTGGWVDVRSRWKQEGRRKEDGGTGHTTLQPVKQIRERNRAVVTEPRVWANTPSANAKACARNPDWVYLNAVVRNHMLRIGNAKACVSERD
jgi:hypothetical protein